MNPDWSKLTDPTRSELATMVMVVEFFDENVDTYENRKRKRKLLKRQTSAIGILNIIFGPPLKIFLSNITVHNTRPFFVFCQDF